MSIALAAKAPSTFEIKSAHLSLVALWLKSSDIAAIAQDMARHYGEMPGFFEDDALVVDLSALPEGDAGLRTTADFEALSTLLRQHRLRAVAVRGGEPEQQQAALAAGLFPAHDASIVRTQNPQPTVAAPVPQAPAPAPVPSCALVIDKPLRSGQQVYARGRDLVVMAMVNPGAEVIADGHIHVYAPLRGKAIAGARGQTDARIFAQAMDPELIAIAGVYRTSENPLPPSVAGKAAQIRLLAAEGGERLVIEPLVL